MLALAVLGVTRRALPWVCRWGPCQQHKGSHVRGFLLPLRCGAAYLLFGRASANAPTCCM